ncbi:MAG: ferritin family protein [Syntrophaceae bacterium]|nr:ferritin family protein [Syntrophaceae bacterium]
MAKLPAALNAALEFEEEGKKYYTQKAAAAKDPLTQKLFQTLAEDESRHAERILEIHAAISNSGPWPATVLSPHRNLEQEMRDFFSSGQTALESKAEPLEGYAFAMEMEKKGIAMYAKQVQEAQDEMEKAFFHALVEEERGHLEAIQNVYYYLSNSEDWYAEEESKRWNWMNL